MASGTMGRPLPENVNFSVTEIATASTSDTVTFADKKERHILFIFGGSDITTGVYIVSMYSSGLVYTIPILVGSSLTFTPGNMTLSIGHPSLKCTYFDIALRGGNAIIS